MIGWLEFAASVALAWGPNHAALAGAVARTDDLERRLVPIEAVVEAAGPLWLVEHDREAIDPLFLTAEAWQGSTIMAAEAWLGSADRLLPQSAVPRLLVARQRYAIGTLALETLAVDVYEPFVRALIEAQVARRLADDDAFAQAAEQRGAQRMTDVDPRFRRRAFLGGAVDYAAQLTAVAHEIARQERRRRQGGESGLCALLDHPATLFGHWRRLIEEAPFPGYAPSAAELAAPDGSPPGSPWLAGGRFTATVLSADDKQWVAETLLGTAWTGDPAADFASLCDDPL